MALQCHPWSLILALIEKAYVSDFLLVISIVRRSLDSESAATLVHAFVTSRIDHVLLAGAAKAIRTTDKLQRLLNAAARQEIASSTEVKCERESI